MCAYEARMITSTQELFLQVFGAVEAILQMPEMSIIQRGVLDDAPRKRYRESELGVCLAHILTATMSHRGRSKG